MISEVERNRYEKLRVLAYEQCKLIEGMRYRKDYDIFLYKNRVYSIDLKCISILDSMYFIVMLYCGGEKPSKNLMLYEVIADYEDISKKIIRFINVHWDNPYYRVLYRKKDFP